MSRWLSPLLGAFLLTLVGCAAAQHAAAPAPQANADAPANGCQGPSVASLKEAMASHEMKLEADYKGAEAQAFNAFLKEHVVDKTPDDTDEIIVWSKEKMGVIVWFKNGCATNHAVGPFELVRPFIGQAT